MEAEYDRTTIDLSSLKLDPYEDKVLGVLLGSACGDILGANCEFKTHEQVKKQYGNVHSFIDSEDRPLGHYTDDTEMTLALATSLVECNCIDGQHCAKTYAEWFVRPPLRGYGPAVSSILNALYRGRDYRKSATMVYAEGSYANGGF